jgi:hypothetical protein
MTNCVTVNFTMSLFHGVNNLVGSAFICVDHLKKQCFFVRVSRGERFALNYSRLA